MSIIAYKLFSLRRDGTLSPLFINRTQRVPVGEWLDAEDHPTKGFAHRPGWHAAAQPTAPHLVMNPKGGLPRVWTAVEIEDFEELKRPKSQGNTWFIANRMKVLEIIE